MRRVDVGLLVACGLALLALAPLLGRGYVLTFDMVFVPEPPLTRGLLGLDSSVPRAVPSDALVAVAARVLPADVVQKLVLLGVFVAGGWGAARLVPSSAPVARAAAACLFAWNAYVYERLLLGHWTLLVSYAALPWVVRAALDLRRDPTNWPRLVVALAVASFGSASGGLVATGTALLVARRLPVLGAGLVLALPWLVPSVLRPGGLPPRPEGIAAFAATADTPLGVLGSLATLGGVWNPAVVPPGRGLLAVAPALLLVLGLALAGIPMLVRRWGRGAALGLVAAALVGLVVAAAGAFPVTAAALRALVTAVPGAGLLRDGQRYLAPLALLQALGFGLTAERLGRLGPLLVAAPVLVLPVLAWGAGGRLAAVDYPADFARARAVIAADEEPGPVLVLPWSAYLAPEWNGGRPVLDPATRWFPRPTRANDDLTLASGTVPGEDPSAVPSIEGVRFVLLHKLDGWQAEAARLDHLDVTVEGPALRLYRAPSSDPVTELGSPIWPVVAGDAAAATMTLAALASLAMGARRR